MAPLRPGRLNWKLSGGTLTILIALGGAVLGSIGSQVVAYVTAERAPQAVSASAARPVTGLLSKSSTAADRLTEIDQALQNRDFGAALLFAEEGLRLFPGDARFNVKRQRAEEEIQNRFRYQSLQTALTRQNFPAAMALFDEIQTDSTFKFKATQDLSTARDQYITEQLRDGQAAAKLAQCAEAKLSAQAVLAVDSSNAAAQTLVADCSKSAPP